jgi:putative phosphonate catabolism associated alcohol dehydrogenase
MTTAFTTRTSLAAVFHEEGASLTLEQFPLPVLAGSEVLVRIRLTTICGSDLHSISGRRHSPRPSILGHEMVGEIVEIGPQGCTDYSGSALNIGDRITWSMVWSCGVCYYCSRGLRSKCERLLKFGHESITPTRALIGGMAEHCWLPEDTAIFRIPANLPDVVASPANCATATVAAVFRHAGIVANQVVVVHGAGMLGLTACAMASAHGASAVIVLEPNQQRRLAALRFGASAALDPTEPADTIRCRILEASGGHGADLGLEFSGFPDSIELGLTLLRMGGRFVMAGATFPSRHTAMDAEQIVRRMLSIQGVYNYIPEDLAEALAFLSTQLDNFPFAELVPQQFPLRQVQSAVAFAEQHHPPRVALVPGT